METQTAENLTLFVWQVVEMMGGSLSVVTSCPSCALRLIEGVFVACCPEVAHADGRVKAEIERGLWPAVRAQLAAEAAEWFV